MLSRESGQSRVPAPPHMITGTIRVSIHATPGVITTFQPAPLRNVKPAALTKVNRSKPPNINAGGLVDPIEGSFEVHDQPAAILKQSHDQRPIRVSIAIMRHRKDDGVAGL